MKRWGRKTLIRALVLFLLLDTLVAAVLVLFVSRDHRARSLERDGLAREIGVTADMGEEEQSERFALAVGEASRLVTLRSEPEVTGQSAALYLSNGEDNLCAVSVELSLFESDELIGQSGLIEPGWRLESLELDRELEPGEYPCLARCYFYTVEGNVFLGQTTRQLLLRVG